MKATEIHSLSLLHWSYLESMSEQTVSLILNFVDNKTAKELFTGLQSPVLIRINCSCDITVFFYDQFNCACKREIDKLKSKCEVHFLLTFGG